MDEKKVQNNNRKANLIANLAEIVIVILYLIFGFKSISEGISDMDFGGMFDDVMGVIWFINIAILALALICLTVKSMRTKYTVKMSIWNIVWIIGNIYFMYA